MAPKLPIRYDTIAIRLSFRWSNYWNHMFELLKVEKIIIFSKNLRVRIIRASELIEDIRYLHLPLLFIFWAASLFIKLCTVLCQPFDAHFCRLGAAVKHPVPHRVKPSFVSFWHPGTLTLTSERQSARISKKYKWRLNPVCHRMLCSCTHIATVDIKVLSLVNEHGISLRV